MKGTRGVCKETHDWDSGKAVLRQVCLRWDFNSFWVCKAQWYFGKVYFLHGKIGK